MYQVIIKGRDLQELKKAVKDIDNELNGQDVKVNGLEKDLSVDSGYPEGALEEAIKETEQVTTVKIEDAGEDIKITFNQPIPAIQQVGRAERVVEANPLVTEAVKSVQENVIQPALAEQAVNVQSNLELDIQGIPHDIRIHASSKAKVADGSWRTKRGVDKKVLAEVTAELKAAYLSVGVIEEKMIHVEAQVSAAPVAEVVAAPVVEAVPVAPAAMIPSVAPVAEVVAAPVVEAVPVAPVLNTVSGHSVQTFKENFAMIVANLITEKKVTQDYINQLLEYFGKSAIYDLDDGQKEELFTSFVTFGFIQAV